MTDETRFDEKVEAICDRDPRFKPQAYGFVMAALSYTLSTLEELRHITGQELLEGIRELGLELYGPMAKEVFNYWGLYSCEDFGRIVFNLVSEGLLSKTDQDKIEDFRDGFDFEEEFVAKFQW
jgi:uncharacterized repeat protein (TIGR04138 family)